MLSNLYPDKGPGGTALRIEGPRFSPDMKVQFDNGSQPPTIVSPDTLSSVHIAWVTVPHGLAPGIYNVNVIQGDVPGPIDRPLNFTVTP